MSALPPPHDRQEHPDGTCKVCGSEAGKSCVYDDGGDYWGSSSLPTTERLAAALEQANAPKAMITAARAGCYDDFKSESPTPTMDLVRDLRQAGLTGLANRAMLGEFDTTNAEAEAWAAEQDGEVAEVLDAMRAGDGWAVVAAAAKDPKSTRDQVVDLYAAAIRSSGSPKLGLDVPEVRAANEALVERWGRKGRDRIKERAWALLEERQRRPVVALGLVTKERNPDRFEVRVIDVLPGEDAKRLAELAIMEHGVHVVGALTRKLTTAELSKYVPGVSACPDCAWIAVVQGEN